MEALLDKKILQYMDTFKVLVLKECPDTLIPELIEAVGPEILPRFLNVFAGITFRVPPRDTLEKLARDAEIYRLVQDGDSAVSVGVQHGLSERSIHMICERVDSAVREVLGGS